MLLNNLKFILQSAGYLSLNLLAKSANKYVLQQNSNSFKSFYAFFVNSFNLLIIKRYLPFFIQLIKYELLKYFHDSQVIIILEIFIVDIQILDILLILKLNHNTAYS